MITRKDTLKIHEWNTIIGTSALLLSPFREDNTNLTNIDFTTKKILSKSKFFSFL